MRDRDRRVGGLPSEKQIGAGMGATERRWDRWSSAIGAQAGSGWLGTIWAREKVSKEREREQRRGVANTRIKSFKK